MTTRVRPSFDVAERRQRAPRFARSRRVAAAVALGAVMFPALADASPNGGAAPVFADSPAGEPTAGPSVTVDDASIFDELTLSEVVETLRDDDFVFDGRNIVVEDPAPLGPFIDDVAAGPADDAVGADAATAESADELTGLFGALGLDDAFSLNSRPEATRTIFLDFDGHTVTGTSWNSTGATIEAGRYRRESATNPDTGFTQNELNGIVEIWQRVAEDFAAWDVNVTTEDPGVDALMRQGVDDDEYGIRTIITPDYEWYDSRRFGGVAYLRSFSRSSDLPAWVFSSNLGTGNPKSVAEAVSHEVGHTLGLQHDGIDDGSTSSSYYSGHGSWAPIMGVGYYRDVTQWSDGDYPGATNTEDDLYIIDGFIDRLSDSPAAGTAALPSGSSSTTTHVLAEGGATTAHTLEVGEGPVTIRVDKLDANGNLLAGLTVRNAANQVVSSASPVHPASWFLTASLPAGVASGTYTVEVRSLGWAGNGSADPGFSSYGSIGNYSLDVDMPTSTSNPPPPDDDPPTPTTTTPTTTTPSTTTPSTSNPPTTNPPTTTPPTTTPPTNPPTNPSPDPTTDPPEPNGAGDGLQPISPLRVLDTRASSSPTTGRLPAGQNLRLDLSAAPPGTAAAVVNVVAADPRAAGWLSITPCTDVAPQDRTSSINFAPGRSVANSIVAPTTANGEICIFASTDTHVVVDVTGWIGASGPLTLDETGSFRVVDSRVGLGIPRRLAAGTTAEIDLRDELSGGDIGAIALNLTAVRPTGRGYITVDDCSGTKTTSSLNFRANETRSNNGIFALGDGQRLCVSTTATTHLTIDVTGEFGAGSGFRFIAATPERVLDTRTDKALAAGASTSFELPVVAVGNGLAVAAAAASVNLTAARATTRAFVTAWDCGPRPDTSALNPTANASTASGALVPLSQNGRSCLYHSRGGHLIVDLSGWWI